MSVYLFDERRWLSDDPQVYAKFLKGAVTDIIVLVYGYRHGGIVGYKSKYIESDNVYKNRLLSFINIMSASGIRVHAAFQVCRINRKKNLAVVGYGSKFYDIQNPEFQDYIVNLIGECATLPVNGICLDYIRTDDLWNPERNVRTLSEIVKNIYLRVKSINPDCIVSSTTSPYKDMTHPKLRKTGRRAIEWANSGYQDILFDMKYGGPKGKAGDPPDMELVYKARELTTTPVIVMVSSYQKGSEGKPEPTSGVKFAKVLNTVFDENDVAIYTGWLFSDEQKVLTQQQYGP